MLIGVPKEIKTHEYRVGLVPSSVRELIHNGHKVLVQTGAGLGIGFDDKAYKSAGARIAASAEEVFKKAEMVVKVKEPQPKECKMLRPGQRLFTYLHLAPDPEQTRALIKSGCTAIAYETVTSPTGTLPLLTPSRPWATSRRRTMGGRKSSPHSCAARCSRSTMAMK